MLLRRPANPGDPSKSSGERNGTGTVTVDVDIAKAEPSNNPPRLEVARSTSKTE